MAPHCGSCCGGGGGGASPDSALFSPAELEVADILLHLPILIRKSNAAYLYCLGLSPLWGRKRKRSAANSASSSASPPPPPKEPADLSPNGPLVLNSFSPSESDENTKRPKKKRASLHKKSEYLEAIDELSKSKQVLELEIEAARRRYTHLKALNSELKSKRQKLIPSLYSDSPPPQIGVRSSSAMETARITAKTSSPALEIHHHHQHQQQQQNQNHHIHHHYPHPSIKNHTAPAIDSSMGPIGIPDLNISLEEFAQRNYSKIKAAQARQRRIRICKSKNSNAAIKLQSPNPCR